MPIQVELFATDLERSVAFYTGVLGFEVTRQEPGGFTELVRGEATLALNRIELLRPNHPVHAQPGERLGRGVEIVFFVDDPGPLHGDVVAAGWPLSTDLSEQSWGLTDFRLVDPDGYYIRVSSRTRRS